MNRTTNKNSPINSKQPFLVEMSPMAQSTAVKIKPPLVKTSLMAGMGLKIFLSARNNLFRTVTVQRNPADPSVVLPSQGHAQSSVSGQNIISRVRWFGIYSLHTYNRDESILSESYLL